MTSDPFQTATNGRTNAGKFGLGNQFAKGHSSRAKQLRTGMLSALEVDDVKAVILTVLAKALGGDLAACKLILSTIGPPSEGDTPATELEITDTNFQRIKNELLARAN